MARRSASGTGNIRKKTTTRNGKQYDYWEARYTAGYDLGTGKQIQRSISGKTQKEVAQKLKAATAAIDNGTYIAPSKQTVGQWLDQWIDTYCSNIKPRTMEIYRSDIRLHLKPAMGAVRLEALTTPMIQAFYNRLSAPSKTYPKGLSPKTVKNLHGVLHKALQQAVLIGLIRFNPSDACTLPRQVKPDLVPFDDDQIAAFLTAIQGQWFEPILTVTLFTGLRQGEVMGLMWDCVDFQSGTITVNKQLLLHEPGGRGICLGSTKNGKSRTITAAPSVMAVLKRHRATQAAHRLRAGKLWQDNGLVFADELGQPLDKSTVYRAFKRAAASIGRPEARFHDLRHSYAVAAIRSGDDIKTIQENLGHATASFTLDVYGHVTKQMRQASAARMDAYIKSVSNI